MSLGLVLVSGALLGGAVEIAELHLAGAGQGEGGSLELLLLGEEEVGRAALVGKGGGDVEVEDAADAVRGCAVERGSVRLAGLGRVDGNDQVRKLEVLGEVAGALLLSIIALLRLLRLLGVLGLLGMFGLFGMLGLFGLVVLAVILLASTVLVVVVLGMILVAAIARLRVDLEPNLDAGVLVFHRLGVEDPATVVAGGAGPEGGRAIVSKVAVLDVEAAVRLGANVALLLRGRRSQDAAAVLAVIDA